NDSVGQEQVRERPVGAVGRGAEFTPDSPTDDDVVHADIDSIPEGDLLDAVGAECERPAPVCTVCGDEKLRGRGRAGDEDKAVSKGDVAELNGGNQNAGPICGCGRAPGLAPGVNTDEPAVSKSHIIQVAA